MPVFDDKGNISGAIEIFNDKIRALIAAFKNAQKLIPNCSI